MGARLGSVLNATLVQTARQTFASHFVVVDLLSGFSLLRRQFHSQVLLAGLYRAERGTRKGRVLAAPLASGRTKWASQRARIAPKEGTKPKSKSEAARPASKARGIRPKRAKPTATAAPNARRGSGCSRRAIASATSCAPIAPGAGTRTKGSTRRRRVSTAPTPSTSSSLDGQRASRAPNVGPARSERRRAPKRPTSSARSGKCLFLRVSDCIVDCMACIGLTMTRVYYVQSRRMVPGPR